MAGHGKSCAWEGCKEGGILVQCSCCSFIKHHVCVKHYQHTHYCPKDKSFLCPSIPIHTFGVSGLEHTDTGDSAICGNCGITFCLKCYDEDAVFDCKECPRCAGGAKIRPLVLKDYKWTPSVTRYYANLDKNALVPRERDVEKAETLAIENGLGGAGGN